MRITRRQLVAAAAAVPVAGALGAGAVGWSWWDRPIGEGLTGLAEDEYAFVQAVAEAWMPPGGEPALSGSEANVGGFLDGVVSAMDDAPARELRLLLQALDDLPVLTHGSRFRHLSLDARTETLRGWLHADQWLLRNAILAVLVLVAEAYTMHPTLVAMIRPWTRCGFGP
ncbi:MAG: gluconate 2-dehydrogenase subunit 3 family protein [Myxococcota bacterium]